MINKVRKIRTLASGVNIKPEVLERAKSGCGWAGRHAANLAICHQCEHLGRSESKCRKRFCRKTTQFGEYEDGASSEWRDIVESGECPEGKFGA
jgi:hypothetical protein